MPRLFAQLSKYAGAGAAAVLMLVTAGCTLSEPEAPIADNAGQAHIVKAEASGPHTVEVTFDARLKTFAPEDIQLIGTKGSWYSLTPLPGKLNVLNASTRLTKRGETVAVLQIEPALTSDATLQSPAAEDPKRIPYLKGYYTGVKADDVAQANHLLTWQMDNGGWYKMGDKYKKDWDGKELKSEWRTKDGQDQGTIDNNATTNEMLFLALMYKDTKDARYKQAVQRGVDFLLKMQVKTGGWPQVYPERGGYSDYVTFNDNAMMRVMNVLQMVALAKYPFNTDIVSDDKRKQVQSALDRGVDYIVKSQIVVDGKKTAWCAQHDPVTYEPRGARAYEHPSISGDESVEIVKYLMALPNPSSEVKLAIQGALEWLDQVKVSGTKYIPGDANEKYFVPDSASTIWYRFYEIGTNKPIFSGRDGAIKHDITEIEKERGGGYLWAGTWPKQLLEVARTYGYFENRVFVNTAGQGQGKQGSAAAAYTVVTPPAK